MTDPVPTAVVLSIEETFRVLDELATVIRMMHGKLGLDEGGAQ